MIDGSIFLIGIFFSSVYVIFSLFPFSPCLIILLFLLDLGIFLTSLAIA